MLSPFHFNKSLSRTNKWNEIGCYYFFSPFLYFILWRTQMGNYNLNSIDFLLLFTIPYYMVVDVQFVIEN